MKAKLFISTSVCSLAAAVAIATPVFACNPQGYIEKQVQDQTSNTKMVDADSAKNAVSVKTGDVLVYGINVSNKGASESSNGNDMLNTVVTDKLPDGLSLVSDPSQRTVTFQVGTLKPQAVVKETVTVKVTSTVNGAVIDNQACYVADSVQQKAAQKGCSDAFVKVLVPVTPIAPVTPASAPIVNAPAAQPTSLVNTGPGNVVATAVGITILGYVGSLIMRAKLSRKYQ